MPRARQAGRSPGSPTPSPAACGSSRAWTSRRRGRSCFALPGIGPWTAEYVAMRALADPDAWLPTDVGVRHALERLGAPPDAAERWRPFRSHAVIHLWASL